MRNNVLTILLTVVLLSLSVCFVGCNSTTGRNNSVYLISYRHDGQFILPIKVSKADSAPDSTRHFKSKMSLYEIYESISADDKLYIVYCDSYIIVQDISVKNLGYCIIYPKQVDKFNYIANNMSYTFQSETNNFSVLEILVPVHLIPALIGNNVLIENKEYEFKSTIESLVSFYEYYGFNIQYSQNGIIVTDTIGRLLGDTNCFDDTINSFEIIIHDSTVAFNQIGSK